MSRSLSFWWRQRTRTTIARVLTAEPQEIAIGMEGNAVSRMNLSHGQRGVFWETRDRDGGNNRGAEQGSLLFSQQELTDPGMGTLRTDQERSRLPATVLEDCSDGFGIRLHIHETLAILRSISQVKSHVASALCCARRMLTWMSMPAAMNLRNFLLCNRKLYGAGRLFKLSPVCPLRIGMMSSAAGTWWST